jgi:hypothetical protein
MGQKFNMESLKNKANTSKVTAPADEKATFLAGNLKVLITDEDTGAVVVETVMTPRGFKAKEDKRSGRLHGGVGWYSDIRGEDAGTYRELPISAGLRVSLAGIKVSPADTIDLTGEAGEDSEDSAE